MSANKYHILNRNFFPPRTDFANRKLFALVEIQRIERADISAILFCYARVFSVAFAPPRILSRLCLASIAFFPLVAAITRRFLGIWRERKNFIFFAAFFTATAVFNAQRNTFRFLLIHFSIFSARLSPRRGVRAQTLYLLCSAIDLVAVRDTN